MANPQHAGPFRKQARIVDKTAKRKAEAADWRQVCRDVDARDKGRCRACGGGTRVTLAAVSFRREHHHIVPRSLGGADTLANVVTLCLLCHTRVHVERSLEIKGNPSGRLKCKYTMRTGSISWREQGA